MRDLRQFGENAAVPPIEAARACGARYGVAVVLALPCRDIVKLHLASAQSGSCSLREILGVCLPCLLFAQEREAADPRLRRSAATTQGREAAAGLIPKAYCKSSECCSG